jgi:hypothetical protein
MLDQAHDEASFYPVLEFRKQFSQNQRFGNKVIASLDSAALLDYECGDARSWEQQRFISSFSVR